MILQGTAKNVRDMGVARDVAETLNKHYPGHLWAVSIEGQVIAIKNLAISHSHGMVLHMDSYYADPSRLKVVRMGGELLERAHFRRGKDTGEDAHILEGVADKYQPSNGIIR
jgi:hypothetical protein